MAEDTTNPTHTVVTVITAAPKKPIDREACLVVIYGDDLGRRIPLNHGVTTIGRSSKCDVQVDQESVSRTHAQIELGPQGYVIKDLGSTNGSYVNDEPIDSTRLRDGDQVKIGRTIFKFISGNNVEAQYHEEIYRLMTVDGLTQVHNKRYFQEALEREVSRCKRYDRACSLVVFDLDHFKSVNDKHGHLAGDGVLRQVGALLNARMRRDDALCRIGGEEFAVLLPEVTLDGAVQVAEKLRLLVESSVFAFETIRIPVTVSLGVATWEASMNEPSDLVRAADAKLYEAKHGGRNRVAH